MILLSARCVDCATQSVAHNVRDAFNQGRSVSHQTISAKFDTCRMPQLVGTGCSGSARLRWLM
eukprot:9604792-Lingulodinium_polyedra.AAC.1